MSSQLIVCGSIAIDKIMSFKGRYQDLIQPDKLEVFSLSVLIDEVKELPGGTGANIAYNLALLGERPILLGSVGKDGADYIKKLDGAGVDTSRVFVSEHPTASFTVLNDSVDNQVGGFYPGAMADADSLKITEFAGQDALITISAHDPAAMNSQVKECARHNLRLFYDVSQQVSSVSPDDIRAGVEAAELIILNDYEMKILHEKTGYSEEDLARKVPVLITTHGRNGSVIEGSKVQTPIKIEASKADKDIDPTGAGDAFRAGFLFGYVRGWELEKSGRLGSVTGSFAVEEFGAQVQYNKDDIKNRYRQTYQEEIIL